MSKQRQSIQSITEQPGQRQSSLSITKQSGQRRSDQGIMEQLRHNGTGRAETEQSRHNGTVGAETEQSTHSGATGAEMKQPGQKRNPVRVYSDEAVRSHVLNGTRFNRYLSVVRNIIVTMKHCYQLSSTPAELQKNI